MAVNTTFLRRLAASLERQLKKKGYFASVTNDLEFEKTREVLTEGKQGKGDKPNASVALTSDELKILYEKSLLRGTLAKQHSSLCMDYFGIFETR